MFGYRGVILFTWTARVYDRDKETRENEKSFDESGSQQSWEGDKSRNTGLYYQGLSDN
ncbi:Polymerase delta-interacting protein 2, partial [Desmophyllum pertusum]